MVITVIASFFDTPPLIIKIVKMVAVTGYIKKRDKEMSKLINQSIAVYPSFSVHFNVCGDS